MRGGGCRAATAEGYDQREDHQDDDGETHGAARGDPRGGVQELADRVEDMVDRPLEQIRVVLVVHPLGQLPLCRSAGAFREMTSGMSPCVPVSHCAAGVSP